MKLRLSLRRRSTTWGTATSTTSWRARSNTSSKKTRRCLRSFGKSCQRAWYLRAHSIWAYPLKEITLLFLSPSLGKIQTRQSSKTWSLLIKTNRSSSTFSLKRAMSRASSMKASGRYSNCSSTFSTPSTTSCISTCSRTSRLGLRKTSTSTSFRRTLARSSLTNQFTLASWHPDTFTNIPNRRCSILTRQSPGWSGTS